METIQKAKDYWGHLSTPQKVGRGLIFMGTITFLIPTLSILGKAYKQGCSLRQIGRIISQLPSQQKGQLGLSLVMVGSGTILPRLIGRKPFFSATPKKEKEKTSPSPKKQNDQIEAIVTSPQEIGIIKEPNPHSSSEKLKAPIIEDLDASISTTGIDEID